MFDDPLKEEEAPPKANGIFFPGPLVVGGKGTVGLIWVPSRARLGRMMPPLFFLFFKF